MDTIRLTQCKAKPKVSRGIFYKSRFCAHYMHNNVNISEFQIFQYIFVSHKKVTNSSKGVRTSKELYKRKSSTLVSQYCVYRGLPVPVAAQNLILFLHLVETLFFRIMFRVYPALINHTCSAHPVS